MHLGKKSELSGANQVNLTTKGKVHIIAKSKSESTVNEVQVTGIHFQS
jgi:hypothetical protein